MISLQRGDSFQEEVQSVEATTQVLDIGMSAHVWVLSLTREVARPDVSTDIDHDNLGCHTRWGR